MPRHTKLAAGRKDIYYKLAKETGYRSRAAFKLLQLNKKYHFLDGCRCVVDLCAAPGGWSQVVVATLPIGSLVIAVDLDPIKPVPGLTAIQSDITSQHCRAEIKKLLNKTPVDVVVHDGAPNVSGDYTLDSFNQNSLVLSALRLACEVLRQGGTFVTKIFRSGEHMQIVYVLRQLFERVEMTKPDSSRETSAEIFAVCQGYRGQFAQVDPQMFDPEVVLQNKQIKAQAEIKEGSLKNLIRDLDYGVRHRQGYEHDLNRRYIDCVRFVVAQQPVQMLGRYSAVLFECDLAADHRLSETQLEVESKDGIQFAGRCIRGADDYARALGIVVETASDELVELLADIKQISRAGFQKVLLWHRRAFAAVCAAFPSLEPAPEVHVSKPEVGLDEAVQLQERELEKGEIRERRQITRQEKKRQMKQLKKFLNYDKDAAADQNRDELFLYQADKDTPATDAFRAGEQFSDVADDDTGSEETDDPNIIPDGTLTKMQRFIFNYNDQDRYFDEIDAQMNLFYQQMQLRQKRARQREYDNNMLLMEAKGIPTEVAQRWFGQEEFKQRERDDAEPHAEPSGHDGSDEFADNFPLPRDNLEKTRRHEKRVKMLRQEARRLEREGRQLDRLRAEHKVGDIQIVPSGPTAEEEPEDGCAEVQIVPQDAAAEPSASSSSESELPPPKESLHKLLNKNNIESTATKIAMANCLLHKKSTRELIESAYGKKFYDGEDDEYNLPDWFVQDEQANNQPQRPITAEEVAEIKEQLKQMQQLPKTRKEREAIARKKMHANQRMSRVQEQIQEVINRDDLNEREKIKKLQKLQSSVEKKPKKTRLIYSNLHKGQAQFSRKTGRGVKFIDRRMKKEIQAEKRREKKIGRKIRTGKR